MWDEHGLDDRIDDAARQLTAGEPGGDLRARVVARIERPRRSGMPGWIAAPIAVAAIVAIVMTIALHRPITPAPSERVASLSEPAAAAFETPAALHARESDTSSPSPSVTAAHALSPATPSRIAAAADVASEGDPSSLASAIGQLTPAPIDIAPLHIEEIPQAAPIVVPDLDVPLIEVRAVDAVEDFNQ